MALGLRCGKKIAFMASTAMAFAPAQLMAQTDEGAEQTGGLGIIVVTAQKREEQIQDVPIAISAFDEDAIQRLNSRDIRDLTGQIPNFTLSEVSIGPGLTQVSIRGVNSQDPERSFDPAVGTFIDGVYLGTSAFNLLDTFDLERLEVLRGPQGTLFGRNTTGGAINAFRRKPTGELGVRAQVTVGNNDRLDLNGEINLPQFGDIASIMFRGQRQKDDGIYANTAGGSRGARDRWSVGAALRLESPGVADITITVDHAEDQSDLSPYVPRGVNAPTPLPVTIAPDIIAGLPVPGATVNAAFGPDLFCVIQQVCDNPANPVSSSTDPHFMDASLDAVTFNGDFVLSDELDLTTIIGWRKSSESVFIDFDGSDQTVFNVVRDQQFYQYSGEIRVASNFDGPVQFVAGAFHFFSDYSLQQAIKLDLANVGVPVPYGVLFVNGAGDEDDFQSKSTALFAQVDWEITDQLKVTLGGRLTWDKKTVFTQFKDAPLPPTAAYQITDGVPANRPTSSSGGATEDWFEFTPRIMVTYEPAPDLLFYGSFTRGYNAGGFSARAGSVADVTTPFDPEFINSYEIGGKLDLLDRNLRINFAGFWNDYSNKQEEAIQPGPPPTFTSTTVRNVAAARIRGVEVEISALPIPELRLDFSAGYLDAEYTNYPGFLGSGQFQSVPAQPAGTLIPVDLSTLELRRTPDFTGSASATYTADLGFGELSVNAQARYVGEQFVEIFNSQRGLMDDSFIVDASMSLNFGGPDNNRYRITVFGENLNNEVQNSSFTNSVVDFGTVSPPRRYGVEFGLDF